MSETTPVLARWRWDLAMLSPVLTREAVYGALAAEQYGLVTSRQLTELGLSRAAISRRVKAGALIEMLPGVWRLAGVPRSWHQRALAVHLWAGELSSIAGKAAAALHKLDAFPQCNVIEVVTPRSLKSPNRLVAVRRPGAFPIEDRMEKLLVISVGTRPSESTLEVKVLRLLRREGYPAPIRQEVLDDKGRFVGRVDLVYRDRRLIIEVDSYEHHDGRGDFDADRSRRNWLGGMGWAVMHATSEMLRGEPRVAFLRDLDRLYHRPLASSASGSAGRKAPVTRGGAGCRAAEPCCRGAR